MEGEKKDKQSTRMHITQSVWAERKNGVKAVNNETKKQCISLSGKK